MKTEEFIQKLLQLYIKPIIKSAVREEIVKLNMQALAPQDEEKFLNAKEAAAFIGDALPTLYGRTSRGEIPTYGSGKKIFIKKSDLLFWMQKQRTKSKSQIEEEVARDLKKN